MERIPFDPYDFFGYISSGLLVLLGMDLVFGFPSVLGEEIKLFDLALLIVAVYVAGQIVATPAKALLEDIIVGRILRRPSFNLLRAKKPRFRAFLFPGFYQPLPKPIQKVILEKTSEELHGTDEELFLHVRYSPEVIQNQKLMSKLDSFVNKYGFARNLSFTSLLVACALLVKALLSQSVDLSHYADGLFVVAILLWYRYLKFFRQYSFEMLSNYAGAR